MLEAETVVPFTRYQEDELEDTLLNSLGWVEPNPEFVGRLRGRFGRQPATVLEHRTFWGVYLIMASGLFMGTFAVWLAHRISSNLRGRS